ncbi:cell division protein FtsZ [compost metagenome]
MSHGLSTRPVGTMKIWGCGGGGVNIAKEYLEEGHSSDIANIDVCFIDTSDSNLEDRLVDKTWLFEGLDGSGAIRQENADAIAKAVPDIVRKFQPAEMNVVVFTLAGGTGSVAGPLILKKLLEEGHMAVGIVIWAQQAIKNAENTIGGVKTLDSISRSTGAPAIVQLGFNKNGQVTDKAVDNEAHLMITSLAMLCSRRNHGLDTADLKSLFNFTKSTKAQAQLCRIHVSDNVEDFTKLMRTGALASAALLKESTDPTPELFVPYSTYGVMPAIAQAKGSLFFGIENGSMAELRKRVSELEKEIADQENAAVEAVAFAGDKDKTSAHGLVW